MKRAGGSPKAERIWRPQPAITASVRFTPTSAAALSKFLDRQTWLARTPNQTLNMVFESLEPPDPLEPNWDTRATVRQMRSDLDDMKRRLVTFELGLDDLERKVDAHGP